MWTRYGRYTAFFLVVLLFTLALLLHPMGKYDILVLIVLGMFVVIGISDVFIAYRWAIFGSLGGGIYAFFYTWKRSEAMQFAFDRLFLRLHVFGDIIRKSVIARSHTMMFVGGKPAASSPSITAATTAGRVPLLGPGADRTLMPTMSCVETRLRQASGTLGL